MRIGRWFSVLVFMVAADGHAQVLLDPPSRSCAPATASANPALCVAAERIELPDTRVSVAIPEGSACSADSTVFFENTMSRFVSCLPVEGGVAFSLQKEIGSHVPPSLDAKLQEWQRVSAAHPEGRVTEPRKLTLSGRNAIEQVTAGSAFFDGPSLHSTGQLASDDYLIQDGDDFYSCAAMAGPSQLTPVLRQQLHAFCDSLAFTN